MNKLNKSLLSLAIVSVLGVGCSSNDDDPSVGPGSLSGNVAKGIVKSGLVEAFLLNDDGGEGISVGTATTGDDGSYSLTMSGDYDGISPLLLKLTAGELTTMVCDVNPTCGVTPYGEDISLADNEDFILTAVIPSVEDGKAVDASITAFTSMAASKVVSDGGVSASTIAAANSEVSQIAGVNILSVSPINVSNDTELTQATPNAQRYSIMLSALAHEAFKDTTDDGVTVSDMIANLNSFNSDFSADGDIGDDGGLSPSAFYAAASSIIEEEADLLDPETVTEANQHITIKDSQIVDGVFTPEATTGENSDEVAQAKAFVTEVRTWANALQDLENPAEAFLDEADTISDTLDSNSGAVLEILAMALDAASTAIGDADDAGDAVPTSVDVKDDDGTTIGSMGIEDTSEAGASRSFIMTATDLEGVAISAAISLNTETDSGTPVAAGDVNLNVNGTASNDEVALGLSNGEFTITLTEDIVIGDDENSDGDIAEKFGAASLKGMLTAASLDAGAATGDGMVGDAEIKFVRLASGASLDNDLDMTLEKIALNNLAVTNADGETAGLSIVLEVNDAASFDTLSYLNSSPEITKSLPQLNLNLDGMKLPLNLESISEYRYNKYGSYDSSTGTYTASSCAWGLNAAGENTYGCVDGDTIGINDQVKTTVYTQSYVTSVEIEDYHVVVGTNDNHGRARLTLTDIETAESFLNATLNITGKIDLDGQDEAMLTITANKTGLDAGNMTATLGYAGKSLQLTATTTDGEEEGTDASLSFSNADGVAMTVSKADDFTQGNVTVGDQEVGVIETQNDILMIRYNDGTFESM